MTISKPLVIQLAGYSKSGKDYVGDILISKLSAVGLKVSKVSYADPLKDFVAKVNNVSREDLDRCKEVYRSGLVYAGQYIREIDIDHWIDKAREKFDGNDIVVITDCRKHNELHCTQSISFWVTPWDEAIINKNDGTEITKEDCAGLIKNTANQGILDARLSVLAEMMIQELIDNFGHPEIPEKTIVETVYSCPHWIDIHDLSNKAIGLDYLVHREPPCKTCIAHGNSI